MRRAGKWVTVFACGGVGLAAVNIPTALGANVVAVSRNAEKPALAKQLGAVHSVTAGPDAAAEVKELTDGGAHVSVDALGAAETAIPAIMRACGHAADTSDSERRTRTTAARSACRST